MNALGRSNHCRRRPGGTRPAPAQPREPRLAAWAIALAPLALAAAFAVTAGCNLRSTKPLNNVASSLSHYQNVALQVDYPDEPVPERRDDFSSYAPHVVREGPPEYWDVPLAEAMRLALLNSPVLRDLGGQILQYPSNARTMQGPSIVETDPRAGVEAALSAFDAQLNATADWEKNDRAINNIFFGGGTRIFQQDYNKYMVELSKRAATGSQFFLRQNTIYDSNNAPANLFRSAWDVNVEAEVRQPLLQGAGVVFNRIAGPNSQIGLPQGVLIARVNTDISLADFEYGVRNLISNVENAYWDLYFAYRDLHAKIVARDSALETWRRVRALYDTGREGGEADKEAQARDQYFYFQAEVEEALTGRLFDGTRTNNGSAGGTFRGNPGVYVTERRLRLTMGLPPNDPRLIRPADEPVQAKVGFDWDQLTAEALSRRVELRRQRWVVKRSELALVAAKNYLLPRLDAQGLYRWRGFGHDLLGYNNPYEFDNAYQNMFGGNFQEWQLGAQFNMPIGFRQGYAAVRNATLVLARERAVLREQELQVIHDLSNSVGDVDRTFVVAQTNYNRRLAANEQLNSIKAAFDAETETVSLLDLVEAQRRLADADSRYARSMVEYTLAIKNVMFESGTLLENNGINLTEGPNPQKALQDAAQKEALRSRPLRLSYILPNGPTVSRGQFPQQTFGQSVQTLAPGSETPGQPGGETIPAPLPRTNSLPGSSPSDSLGPPPANLGPPESSEQQNNALPSPSDGSTSGPPMGSPPAPLPGAPAPPGGSLNFSGTPVSNAGDWAAPIANVSSPSKSVVNASGAAADGDWRRTTSAVIGANNGSTGTPQALSSTSQTATGAVAPLFGPPPPVGGAAIAPVSATAPTSSTEKPLVQLPPAPPLNSP